MGNTMTGIGVSPGVATGKVYRIEHKVIDHAVPATPRQVLDALTAVGVDLERRSQAADLEVAREVLSAQAMIAQDAALVEAIGARLPEDVVYPDVRDAIRDAFGGFRVALEALGGYFAERVNDLDEIANRTIQMVSGETEEAVILSEPSIVVAEDLTPADTAAPAAAAPAPALALSHRQILLHSSRAMRWRWWWLRVAQPRTRQLWRAGLEFQPWLDVVMLNL